MFFFFFGLFLWWNNGNSTTMLSPSKKKTGGFGMHSDPQGTYVVIMIWPPTLTTFAEIEFERSLQLSLTLGSLGLKGQQSAR